MIKFVKWVFIILICSSAAGTCLAETLSLHSAGVRYGTNDGIDKKTDLRRYEAFGIFTLPWNWQITSNIDLDTLLITSAGLLDGEGDRGLIGTLSPGISFTDRKKIFSFELSGGIAILPDYRIGAEDFGGPLQFTFGGGIGVRLFKNLSLGYRIQHYSDASLFGNDNRGVDWQLFEISYRFLSQ
jgi:hypothetical protein